MPKYHVEYDSNNSGGSWWLTDDEWRNLEKNGWSVLWISDKKPESLDIFERTVKETGRWLGALATRACKTFDAYDEVLAVESAKKDFQSITDQNPDDEGCDCCGSPHYFSAWSGLVNNPEHEHEGCMYDYWYGLKES